MVHEALIPVFASGVAECFCYPIDTVKIWMQVRNTGKPPPVLASGFFKTPHAWHRVPVEPPRCTLSVAKKVFQKEPSSFYRGFSLGFVRTGGMMPMIMMLKLPLGRQISSLAGIRSVPQKANQTFPTSAGHDLLANVLGAASSSAVCSALFVPLDTLKTRIQAESYKRPEKRRYAGTYHAIKSFVSRHGVRALWTGSAPTVLRQGIYYGLSLPAYEVTKNCLISHHGFSDTPATHIGSSAFAGLIGVFLSQPFDVIKTKMMNQSQSNPKYSSSRQYFLTLLRAGEGSRLFTGFTVRYLRNGPWQMIFFVTYEQCMRMNTS